MKAKMSEAGDALADDTKEAVAAAARGSRPSRSDHTATPPAPWPARRAVATALGAANGGSMGMLEVLEQTGGLRALAGELGIDESQAASAAAALVPAILGGFKQQTQAHPAGLEGLLGALAGLGGSGLLDEVLSPRPTDVSRGNDVLSQIFGSRDVSRTVAQNAAGRTGLDPTLLKRMLPMLAMLVVGYLSRHGAASAGAPQFPGSAGGGHAGLAWLLDLNGDGNPLDDTLSLAGQFVR